MLGGLCVDVRALHGVNLAGWLTLESWVTPEPFANSGALDEPTLAQALGSSRYRALVAAHRNSFVDARDFKRIAARGFNAVRIPVPWYVLGGAGPNPGGFVGCVTHVDHAFDWAEEIGLKLVLSLAVSPGRRAVGAGHHGAASPAWANRDTLVSVVAALASRYARRAGLYGIEVLDRPVIRRRRGLGVTDGITLHALRDYYHSAYRAIRDVAGDDVVVIMPHGGASGAWHSFASRSRHHNVWLSCQLFHHADRTNATGRSDVRRLVGLSQRELADIAKSGLPVAVSAWSGALPYADALTTPEGRIALERVYLAEQLAAFRSCPAWFFHTWKTSGRLTGWDARVSLATFERRMLV